MVMLGEREASSGRSGEERNKLEKCLVQETTEKREYGVSTNFMPLELPAQSQ